MNYNMIVLFLILLIPAVKLLLDLNTLTLKIGKSKELIREKNALEKKYQFIKGLY
jgi:hypothetical protein